MADFAYSSTVQDQVSNLLFGNAYSACTTAQKAMLDGSSSASPPTAGVALQAWQQVGMKAQWWYQGGALVSPDVWASWFVARMAKIAAVQYRPDRYPLFKDLDQQGEEAVVKTFQKDDPSGTSLSTTATTTTIRTIRYETMQAAINRQPAIFLSPSEIDSATLRCIQQLWNEADWLFARREVTFTIATDSTVTNDLSGETFDRFVSTRLTYTDTAGSGLHLFWADPDKFADAYQWSITGTGRPQYFRFYKSNPTTPVWQFSPAPDTSYTARALVKISGPGTPSTATETTVFDKFPVSFHQLIKDWVLAECLCKRSGDARNDGEALRRRVRDEIERLTMTYADAGNVTIDSGAVRDVYNDMAMFGRYNTLGGGV
jgi:hypothetical protein